MHFLNRDVLKRAVASFSKGYLGGLCCIYLTFFNFIVYTETTKEMETILKEVKKQITHVKDDINIIKENSTLVKRTYTYIDLFQCASIRNLTVSSIRVHD